MTADREEVRAHTALIDLEACLRGPRGLEEQLGTHVADVVPHQLGKVVGTAFAAALTERLAHLDGPEKLTCALAECERQGYGRFELEVVTWPLGKARVRVVEGLEASVMEAAGTQAGRPVCGFTCGLLVALANDVFGRSDLNCLERTCRARGDANCCFELGTEELLGEPGRLARFAESSDMRHYLNLLEVVFDRLPAGMAVFNRDMTLWRANATWLDYVRHYTHIPPEGLAPGENVLAGNESFARSAQDSFARVLAGEWIRREAFRVEADGIVSYWDTTWAPLVVGGQVSGAVFVTTDATERVAAQMELERRVQERTAEIERRRAVAAGLRDIMAILNSNRPLREILDCIVTQASSLLGTTACAVFRLQPDGASLAIQAAQGLPDDYMANLNIPVGMGAVGMAVQRRAPVPVGDAGAIFTPESELLSDPARRPYLLPALERHRAVLAVPLIAHDEVFGGIVLYYDQPRDFGNEEIDLAVTFAHQAALAIENARLQEQARAAAVAAERDRLARELHDSVSQSLFSASLIAEVLPRLCERDSADGQQQFEELRRVTHGALAEMRSLLLELRPGALTAMALPDLLDQLVAAQSGRSRLQISLKVEGKAITLPAEVQIAFYRVAQGVLKNIAQYARATEATIRLRYPMPPEGGALVIMSVGHDGPGCVEPECPGKAVMRQLRVRAEAAGASFSCADGEGMAGRLSVSWPSRERKVHL